MIQKKIYSLCFLFLSLVCFSQGWDDPGFGGSSKDPAATPLKTPIDGIELPLIITAIIVAIVVIRRMQKSVAQ